MFWSTIDIDKQEKLLSPTFLRDDNTLAFIKSLVSPMQMIVDETLYKMQHDGRKIYLEKVLNEAFNVVGYDHQNHETTKKIFIEDIARSEKIYIHQDNELDVIFMEDDGDDNDNDIFIDVDTDYNYSWIINMPSDIPFLEYNLRALVDSFRYAGKIYTINIYTV